MMLIDRPQEQETLFKEIIFRKLNVREAEGIARQIAVERVRKLMDPELVDLEEKFKESLGTRVRIEKKEKGGKITIDFFSPDDLRDLLEKLSQEKTVELPQEIIEKPVEEVVEEAPALTEEEEQDISEGTDMEDESLYSVTNFSI
jgi:hypothetical protein